MAVTVRRAAALAAVALVATALPALAGPARRTAAFSCTGDGTAQPISVAVAGEIATGLVVKPPRNPRGIVVAAHGYGHTVESWRDHLERISAESGVIAVAMNYRHQIDIPPGPGQSLPSSRGWRVAEGAEDSIAVARLLEGNCPTANRIVLYSVSMGSNAGGLALAAQPRRTRSRAPLFDVWFNIEGAANVVETYFEARALSVSGNATAVNAVEDIEAEMGGPFEERSDVYLERAVVNRVDDIAASGVRNVFVVHGVGDGLVPYNQSAELVALLRAHGVPTSFTTLVTRTATSEPGTTADGYLPIPGHTSPFAGHASEASKTHVVGLEGFDLLRTWLAGRGGIDCTDEVYDGTTAVRTPGIPTC